MQNIKFLNEGDNDGRILIRNVKLAYPHIIAPWALNESSDKKFSVVALLPVATHREEIKALRDHVEKFAISNKLGKLPAANKFIRDGEDSSKDAYAGHWTVNASDNAKNPPVLRMKGEKLDRESDREELEKWEYSGVIADVLIRPWAQSNQYGKKVNANLLAVNFRKRGELITLGAGIGDTDDVWDDDEEYDDDDDI